CNFILTDLFCGETSMDDNVIRPTFGAKTNQTSKQQSEPTQYDEPSDDYRHIGKLEGPALLRAQHDLLYLLKSKEHVSWTRDKLEQLGDIIFNLKDFSPSKQSIELRRQGLRSSSLEEICNLAEGLDETQSRSQPSYLGALTLEHHARVQVALSLLNGTDSP
ncbi:hypothetical protein KJ848_03000, partial [Patescibacteria group bacterium]|nr:hypothetical protein [Patescibacteria group bacterium]